MFGRPDDFLDIVNRHGPSTTSESDFRLRESTRMVHREAEQELAVMMNFRQEKAKNRGPPDPRHMLERVSTLIVIHALADVLPAEQARKIQRSNFDAFKEIASTWG